MQGDTGGLDWIETTPLSVAMRTSLWLYPIVEIVHIVGFVILVGSIIMFDLRLLGFSKPIPVRALAGHLLPWTVASLLLIVPAGLLMFAAHPQDFISNPIFLLKLSLIGSAGLNALAFHTGPYRFADEWNSKVDLPARVKMHATLSLLLWIGVIACGRLLAYT